MKIELRFAMALGLLSGYLAGGAWALFGTELTFQELLGAWPFAAIGAIGIMGVLGVFKFRGWVWSNLIDLGKKPRSAMRQLKSGVGLQRNEATGARRNHP